MNLFDFKSVDWNKTWHNLNENPGDFASYPGPLRLIVALLLSIGAAVLFKNMLINSEVEKYEKAQAQEKQLKLEFTAKYRVAVNADAYKEQLVEMENEFSQLLKRLPTEHETPGLLDDVSFVGTTSGLTFTKINWESEIQREFYTELPLRLEVVGGYHEFGEFLGRVAALPRIVTLHDFTIKVQKGETLRLNLLAKTYRYKDSTQGVAK